MNRSELEQLAKHFRAGRLSLPQFIDSIEPSSKAKKSAQTNGPVPVDANLKHSTLDLDRQQRCGFPEVIYGEGKSKEAIADIFRTQLKAGIAPLATRVDQEKGQYLTGLFPEAIYHQVARTVRFLSDKPKSTGLVGIITAGTSDLPVAEEAAETLNWMDIPIAMIHDVGVAGPHRLPEKISAVADADAVIVVAGMEGALPSVAGGYLSCPVIAVPTSVGYGASFNGIAALLGMLNSCASNVSVVNIDAGFKAAYIAGLISKRCQ
ncbi:MAG: 1-(5-phosphoribosyl)-5-amino-4-imidazole-carboxylate carboxylase [Blastopirellula sp.]|nr:MAG: 1-(5-phosphoribosyl)-5-amino-4-imidazole-carboxylate carboxylase [Blastopirellula sp.]